MKQLVSFLALLLALTSSAATLPTFPLRLPRGNEAGRRTATVYVCVSKSSVAYHSRDNCAGLNRCSHEVRAMSVTDAQQLGKRACRKCY
jgi:hypothetical protein